MNSTLSCNRNTRLSMKFLENTIEKLEFDINKLLDIKLSDYEHDHGCLIEIATNCKAFFKEYSDATLKLINIKNDLNELTKADELRHGRRELHSEIKQIIKLINSYLGTSCDDISFASSIPFNQSISKTTVSDDSFESPLNIASNLYECVRASSPKDNNLFQEHVLEQKVDTKHPNLANDIPSRLHNMSLFDQDASIKPKIRFSMNNPPSITSTVWSRMTSSEPVTSLTSSHVNALPPFHSHQYRHHVPPVTSTVGSNNSFNASNSANLFSARPPIPHHPSNYYVPPTTSTLDNANVLPRGSHAPPVTPTVGSNSAFLTGTGVNFNPVYAPATSNSNHYVPPNISTLGNTHSFPHGSHVSSNPVQLHHNLQPPAVPGQTSTSDALTTHILKNQLFQKIGEPFNGNPHRYHAWVNVMHRKMSGLSIDSWDVMTIMYENTIGKPKKVIEDYMNIGAANPQSTLGNLWNALYDQFGTGTRIAAAIMNKLDSFPPIKSVHNTEKLGELINMCHIITVNMAVAEELQIFNLSLGMRRVWVKLPEPLQNSWRTYSSDYKYNHNGTSPTLMNFISFLERKYREFNDPCYEKQITLPEQYKTPRKITMKTEAVPENNNFPTNDPLKCLLHPSATHDLSECNAFIKKTFAEKRRIIIDNNRCFVCLGSHFKSKCPLDIICKTCNGSHATAMHRDVRNQDTNNSETPSSPEPIPSQFSESTPPVMPTNFCTSICGGDLARSCSKVLLVDLSFPSKSSKTLRCYAIVDEQSSSSFVDNKVADYFTSDLPSSHYKIRTLSGLETTTSGKLIQGLKVKGVNQKKVIDIPYAVTNNFIPNCKNEIATPGIVSQHGHISHLSKHFSNLDEQADVLVLLGRDCGAAMSTQCFGYRAPFAHRTPLGWALVGVVCKSNCTNSNPMTVLKVQSDIVPFEHFHADPTFVDKQLLVSRRSNPFIESPDDELPGMSKEDDQFLEAVALNLRVNDHGNISMPLPFRHNDVRFPDNKRPVYHRTLNTLNRMKQDPAKLSQCMESMQKNIDAGHVEIVPPNSFEAKSPGARWYLPVFAVTHPRKGKVRLVFDSTASYHGTSLNAELLQGPDVNTQLSTVLHRFRKGVIAFTADIESMFYAFHLEQSDRDYNRFFWWKDNNSDNCLVEYRATRHIFGNKSSPSVANMGLRFAVSNSSCSTDLARDFVYNNFYVDDGCGSADSVDEAIATLKDTRASLSSYNIRLHKITSNSQTVLEAFPPSELDNSVSLKDFNHLDSQRTLGVEWNPSSDMFIIRTNVPCKPYTKRGTLATTNSLFDPLGFASPVALAGRLLQRFFIPPKNGSPDIVKLDWDDPLPAQHQHLWDNWTESLRSFDGKVSIPRSFYPSDFVPITTQTLHVFCDASEEGTGCVMYIRTLNSQGGVHVSFVYANSRVSPRGTSSIPRLELCAALDATVLAYKIAHDINVAPETVQYYSDSRVVLGYLSNTHKRFARYVARRVSIILKSSNINQWHYIATEDNPGDVASRPQTFKSLTESCWFRGPSFLWLEHLPEPFESPDQIELPETISEISNFKISSEKCISALNNVFNRVDSWSKLVNVTNLVLDFIVRTSELVMLRHGKSIVPKPSTSNKVSINFILRAMQLESFPTFSSSSPTCPQSISDISNLSPFLDSDGILRVGGRLQRSQLTSNVKFPIILPQKHPVTVLLIKQFHCKTKHQGRIITMSAIRDAGYYIYRGTSAIKKFIHECVTCRKLRANFLTQRMSDLPYDRLHETPPFTFCGMDVFGPFHVTDGVSTRRTNSTKKTWGIVFICLVTKAVHLEPLPYMDTTTFKHALRRFFSVRGVCRKLRCDRGSNFIGAKNHDTHALDMEVLKKEVQFNECEWEFNPPYSSHFGGIWERSIKSIRKILNVSLMALGKRPPTKDELHTFLCEAAAIINNTPMYEICDDPNEDLPLTPARLLTLKDNPNPPPFETFDDHDLLSYGSRRWRRVQAMSENFWKRWRSEYVQQLQNRQKWLKQKPNVQKGDIVLMKVKNSSRNVWPMAKVNEVKTSDDGLVRSVSLLVPSSDNKNVTKLLDRPITNLVPILMRSDVQRF